MTSLVILIFLTHPCNNSSRVHSSFFTVGWGFFQAPDRENIIGVVLLLLAVFDKGVESLGLVAVGVDGALALVEVLGKLA